MRNQFEEDRIESSQTVTAAKDTSAEFYDKYKQILENEDKPNKSTSKARIYIRHFEFEIDN